MNKRKFSEIVEKIRGLHPPKLARKGSPLFKAQVALHRMADGHQVQISDEEWVLLPWRLKLAGIRSYRVSADNCYHSFNPYENKFGAACALDWLLSNGWRASPQPARDSTGDGEKQGELNHEP